MRTRIRIRLAIFAVLSLVAVAYTGARYAQVTDKIFSETYQVSVDLPTSGGLFAGAEVDYRGVPIGKVSAVDLSADGVVARLQIRKHWHIPADVAADIHNRSAVGEQYVDIVPATSGPPYLQDGATIPRSRTTTPLPEQDLILNVDRLARSVNTADLRTVVGQLGAGFRGSGPDLQRLLDGSSKFVSAANSNLPATVALLKSTRTVLRTQLAGGSDFRSFAHDLALVTTTVRHQDPSIRTVLRTGPPLARELTGLLNDLSLVTPSFLTNMIALNAITGAHLNDLGWGLAIAPYDVAAVQAIAYGGRSYLGLALDQSPPVCQHGFLPPSKWRSTNDLSPAPAPFGLGCTDTDKVYRGTRYVP